MSKVIVPVIHLPRNWNATPDTWCFRPGTTSMFWHEVTCRKCLELACSYGELAAARLRDIDEEKPAQREEF